MSAKITCEFLHDQTVNFAMQQNHVPVVKRLRLTNDGDSSLTNLRVRLTCDPEFARPWEMTVASVPAAQTVDVGVVDLQLLPTYLAGLTERVDGRLTLSVCQDEALLYQTESEIAVLAFDEWNGSQTLPEIIAAFVTPNYPEIAKLLRLAADLLKEWTGDPSLNGYQSKDPMRARQQAAAIYAALQQQNISYIVPPASFEEQGQKIRLPGAILEFRMGTCLDLTVLFAACAEAAGLHPLVIFIEGHVFPGVWLVEESFAESLQDDPTLLSKRIDPGVQEVCVLESTALTSDSISFDQAVALGEDHLRQADEFRFFVDIRRARISQIRPLPLKSQWETPAADAETVPTSAEPALPVQTAASAPVPKDWGRPMDNADPSAKPEGERSRLEQWERRLLDLSLRNPLLNFRVTASSIPLLAVDLNQLEDRLAAGQDFTIHPRPADWDTGENERDPRVFQSRQQNDPRLLVLGEEFKQNRLRADLAEKDLSNRLTSVYRAARSSLEENGTNTLYLALGLLVWYESEASQKPRYAPIILLSMEIVRKSVQTGYIVREGGDEPQLNVTLIEMLRQDHGIEIPGLDPLPADERGIDVKRVFTTIRRAVMHKPRWEVAENACLGLFSFSKFMMWHDLKNRSEQLKQNKIVASLLAGSLTWTPDSACPAGAELDAIHPRELICPISADSSQLTAVCAAGQGRSLVLHGPPGTGKSQTITNIIAYVLSQGKTVLFVAEKMAALTVVQRRLEQIGLAPFCLEVHSNKSKKKSVLDQLNLANSLGKTGSPQSWAEEADRLKRLRDELNEYVTALHQKRMIGHSFFQALAISVAHRNSPGAVSFTADQVQDLTGEKLYQWNDLARRLRVAGQGCGGPCGHVWTLSRCAEYLPQLRTQLEGALAVLRGALDRLTQAKPPLSQLFGLTSKPDDSHPAAATLGELAKHFLATPAIPGTMVRLTDWEELRSTLDTWIRHGRIRNQLRDEVLSRYHESVLKFDAAGLRAELQTVKRKWFLPRYFGLRKIHKTMQGMLRAGAPLNSETLERDLAQIERLQEENAFLMSAGDRAREVIGGLWQEGDADWDAVAGAGSWTAALRKLAADIAGTDLASQAKLRESWSQLISEYREQLAPDGIYGRQLRLYLEAFAGFNAAWQGFVQMAAIDQKALEAAQNDTDSNWLSLLKEQVQSWESSLDQLRDWCSWRQVRDEAAAAGLLPLISPYEAGLLTHDQVEPAFKRGLYQAWIENELSRDKVLSSFNRGLFEDKIEQFRQLDDTFARLTREEVFARLASRLPAMNTDAVNTSELGILQRELLRQRGHMALRQLFSKIPNLLSRLKPCMLMSPMSVAQYLDPAHPPFDLVIFDEASQVPTCDAAGAIARGKEAVVVGDPKQLPPTSFFMNVQNDEEEDDSTAIKDLESILDDCLAIRMPEEHLRWHYRSQHESLISFSNYQYYDNSLLTFPSPDDLTPAVQLVPVGGFYDRSKSKQNRAEAEAIVAEILRRLADPKLCQSTIGVVTFSQVQQRLILDLLDEAQRQNPHLEQFFAGSLIEPVFVKNLENVQGDERDVILFSVGYGPDAQGRITHNFGPLNREGGWRRLNVAVSRARQEMLVFSTLRADQLDLSKTNARGVADLKAFLEYAERGQQALYAKRSVAAEAEPDSLFEEQVGLALKERGHQVQAQVGCSGYRIDLAIVDPEKPGRYLLGIECDGATYHRSQTARDRDKLREMVLRQLGWEIHRIWSTDWWENPQREIERVEKALEEASAAAKKAENSKAEPQRIAVQAVPAPVVSAQAAPAPAVSAREIRASAVPAQAVQAREIPAQVAPVGEIPSSAVPASAGSAVPASAFQNTQTANETMPEQTLVAQPTGDGAPAGSEVSAGDGAPVGYRVPYQITQLEPASKNPEEFYEAAADRLVSSQIAAVIEQEGPVSYRLICRRVIQAWGMARVGNRIDARISDLCRQQRLITSSVDDKVFFWPRGTDPEHYGQFRVPDDRNNFRRETTDIPPEEIKNAAWDILRQQISLPQDDLVRETAKAFGHQRPNAESKQYITGGIELLLKSGRAKRDQDNRIVLG